MAKLCATFKYYETSVDFQLHQKLLFYVSKDSWDYLKIYISPMNYISEYEASLMLFHVSAEIGVESVTVNFF